MIPMSYNYMSASTCPKNCAIEGKVPPDQLRVLRFGFNGEMYSHITVYIIVIMGYEFQSPLTAGIGKV